MCNWAKDLKVGDKVIVSPSRHSSPRYVSKIKRMTKTLIITEDEKRFSKKWLSTPGESWWKNYLHKWTQEIEYTIKLKKKKKALIQLINESFRRIKFSTISIEELEDFRNKIKQLND